MLESNRRAREFLFDGGWDWLWFKSHQDMRKKKAGDYYYNRDGKATRCLDPYNLFDACGYDGAGIFWWIQIKTDNWPDEQELKNFMIGKMGCCIIAINVIPPKKKGKTYRIKTRMYEDGRRINDD